MFISETKAGRTSMSWQRTRSWRCKYCRSSSRGSSSTDWRVGSISPSIDSIGLTRETIRPSVVNTHGSRRLLAVAYVACPGGGEGSSDDSFLSRLPSFRCPAGAGWARGRSGSTRRNRARAKVSGVAPTRSRFGSSIGGRIGVPRDGAPRRVAGCTQPRNNRSCRNAFSPPDGLCLVA